MTLEDLYNTGKYLTDKGEEHSYISHYYSKEFSNRYDKIKIMEIGMGHFGGSIDLWLDWFVNGEVVLIENDQNLVNKYKSKNSHISRLKIIHADAYDEKTLNMFEDDTFDWIIDDGPHTIESQIFSIKKWVSKLKVNGKLIIEDVLHDYWVNEFNEVNKYPYKCFDLKNIKNRFDDYIYETTKI